MSTHVEEPTILQFNIFCVILVSKEVYNCWESIAHIAKTYNVVFVKVII